MSICAYTNMFVYIHTGLVKMGGGAFNPIRNQPRSAGQHYKGSHNHLAETRIDVEPPRICPCPEIKEIGPKQLQASPGTQCGLS